MYTVRFEYYITGKVSSILQNPNQMNCQNVIIINFVCGSVVAVISE